MKPYKTSQGNWQLNYLYTLSGRQHTLSLGRGYTATAAERTAKIVSELVLLRKIGETPPTDLLHRVSNLPVRVQASLERGGLILCCFGLSIGEFTEKFIESRRVNGVKPSTLSSYRTGFKYLIQHFGYDRVLADAERIFSEDSNRALLYKNCSRYFGNS